MIATASLGAVGHTTKIATRTLPSPSAGEGAGMGGVCSFALETTP